MTGSVDRGARGASAGPMLDGAQAGSKAGPTRGLEAAGELIVIEACEQCGFPMQGFAPSGAVPGSTVFLDCPGVGCIGRRSVEVKGLRAGDPPREVGRGGGRTRALIIGINYLNSMCPLRGCWNDVRSIKALLTETFGWSPDCIRTMTDEEGEMPTRENILAAVKWLVKEERPEPGDSLFFHFSGHGSQMVDPSGLEEDGYNETIVPLDFQEKGQITDNELAKTLLVDLPDGVKVTVVLDCCHGGTGLDLPYMFNGTGMRTVKNPWFHQADCQLLSGARDDQTASDVVGDCGRAFGAMTEALRDAFAAQPDGVTYAQLMGALTLSMVSHGRSQRPQLSSSQMFDPQTRMFSLTDAAGNTNHRIGHEVNEFFTDVAAPNTDDPWYQFMSAQHLAPTAAEIGQEKKKMGLWAIKLLDQISHGRYSSRLGLDVQGLEELPPSLDDQHDPCGAKADAQMSEMAGNILGHKVHIGDLLKSKLLSMFCCIPCESTGGA